MWANRKSISSVVDELSRREPAYCPNPSCSSHLNSQGKFHRRGSRAIGRYPYLVYRFSCFSCGKNFSSSFFTLAFRDRLNDAYEEIFDFHCLGVPKRAIARFLNCSEASIRAKISKLARWSLTRLAKDSLRLKITEPVAYDGLENFSFSQYDPNNLNHVVGKLSFYTYDFNLAPMNRKGRMSQRQKLRKRSLEENHGKYPKAEIHSSTRRIFSRLCNRSLGFLELHSDNHYAYREVLDRFPQRKKVLHQITPAKLARNYRNRLFAINHLDLLTRQKLAAFKRETIAFAKTSVAMLEGFAIFAAWKNYVRPIFEKPHAADPTIHLDTPAMRVGLEKKPLSFHELFQERITPKQACLHEDWARIFQRIDPLSRRPIRPYAGL
jgi:transposase-like protein